MNYLHGTCICEHSKSAHFMAFGRCLHTTRLPGGSVRCDCSIYEAEQAAE
jgi:hypothetical protein